MQNLYSWSPNYFKTNFDGHSSAGFVIMNH